MEQYIVREYARVIRSSVSHQDSLDLLYLAIEEFDELTSLLEQDPDDEYGPVLKFSRERGRDVLRIQEYVGVIQLPSGIRLEILPKVTEGTAIKDVEEGRAALVRMLDASSDLPYRLAPNADLSPEEMSVFEALLHQFLMLTEALVVEGLAHSYLEMEGELPFFKGVLDVSRQIQYGLNRPSFLQLRYEEYIPDRPENRLLKSAVLRAQGLTSSSKNKRKCLELLAVMDEVPESSDVRHDLALWHRDRSMDHYAAVEHLLPLVLHELNPLSAPGSAGTTALLFPMPRVFEEYAAACVRKLVPTWRIEQQVREKHIAILGKKRFFRLRPDLRITKGTAQVILDTKWKRIRSNSREHIVGIGIADVYQMLAYSEAFFSSGERKKMVLLYPLTRHFALPIGPLQLINDAELYICPLSLKDGQIILDPLWAIFS